MKKVNTGYLVAGYHLLLLIILPLYLCFHMPSLGLIISTIIIIMAAGLGITMGYHRLYSHRSYEAHPILQVILLFLGTLAIQSSALKWACDHRRHHGYQETELDPYNIHRGFWFAHCLWLFEEDHEIDPKLVSDMIRNKIVCFQDKYYLWLVLFSNGLLFSFIGWLTNDFLGAFAIATLFRICFVHHGTFAINSIAHKWGAKPFNKGQTATNNFVVSLITFGEGYHNYHHVFPFDYRNGIQWYHYDPSKWFIWVLKKVGLAYNLRKASKRLIEKRIMKDKKRISSNARSDSQYS